MTNAQSKIIEDNFGPIIGRIYRIVSDSTTDVYVGSTKHSLSKRFTLHKAAFKQYQAGKAKYVSSSHGILKNEDAGIETLSEVFEGEDIKAVEQWWIENTSNCINKNRAIPLNTVHHCKVCDLDIKLSVNKQNGNVVNCNLKHHENTAKHIRNLAKLSSR